MQSDTQATLIVASALRRWIWLILLVAVISAGIGWFQQTRTPRNFEAETALLYRFGREYFPISPGEQRRNWGENVMVSLDAAIFTEMRLLSSHQLFERTLDKIGVAELERRPAPNPIAVKIAALLPFGADEDVQTSEHQRLAAVRDLAESFDITRVQGAALVQVAARHPVPEVADRIVTAHIEAYLEWRSELFDRDASAYFESQLARAREEHGALLGARRVVVQEYGIFDATVERELARQELAEAERLLLENPDDVEWSQTAMEARANLQQVDLFERITEPLDARIRAVLDNIAALEAEEANWRLTRDFSETVAPVVAVIDERTATDNAIGLSPKVSTVLAGAFGAIFVSVGIAAFALIAQMIGTKGSSDTPAQPAPARPASKPSTSSGSAKPSKPVSRAAGSLPALAKQKRRSSKAD